MSPVNRLRPTASARISHSASTAVNSGSVAVSIPATEELTRSSPQAVKNVGRAMSRHATAATGRTARRRPASGTRNAAPSTHRPNTTTEGGRCVTATRMNRNELPQMTDVAANSTHAFRFTVLACGAGLSLGRFRQCGRACGAAARSRCAGPGRASRQALAQPGERGVEQPGDVHLRDAEALAYLGLGHVAVEAHGQDVPL